MPTLARLQHLRWQGRLSGSSISFLASFHQSTAVSQPTRETNDSTTAPIDHPIEEELLPRGEDRLRWFHPTQPGEILGGRFKTIVKLGFGAGSTVWLAENVKFKRWRTNPPPRFVCIKIAALDTDASGEMERSKLISHAKPTHEGLVFLRTPIDAFQLRGPEGTHSCLVFKPMRETLYQLQRRLKRQRLPVPLFKLFMYCLLQALDYLHTECDLIHTDIKDDNIMVSIENDAVLTGFVRNVLANPQPRHIRPKDGRVTYLSQSDLGPLRAGESSHLSAIQSHRFRAPEVLLGCAWSYSVDIWYLGLLMWNLLEDTSLFERPAGSDGEYDAHVHLAQMVSLLGDPPKEVIRRERMLRNHQLEQPVINLRGKTCNTMNEFWGGPFFDDDCQINRKDLIDKDEGKKLSDTVTELTGDEKETFLDFASGMLQWLPEKRKTAKELLQHPFSDSLYKDRERDIEACRSRHT
ncbi:non-specific serine/threonine protein kinase [Madurella fahalii]|uniref:non-specific serine/threonine protein kinase n=1 Tax=Madurella fahalii TaxID=1157608 RepID=A0ABQ0GMZ6_9PEZI